jgi:hypothetical protein
MDAHGKFGPLTIIRLAWSLLITWLPLVAVLVVGRKPSGRQ